MARVASCPQCDHELLVPSEAESESWAKCPKCRAFFQVKQATSREVQAALLVDVSDRIDLETENAELPTMTSQDDLETAVAESPSARDETAPAQADDLEFDDLIAKAKEKELEATAIASDEVETEVAEQYLPEREIAAAQSDDLELDDFVKKPKKGDELEAAAQRIDEWFRSAKTVPDATLVGDDGESPSVEEIRDDLAPAGPSRANATIDMDADDADDLAAMADFDLGEPDGPSSKRTISEDQPAWDDAERMTGLLGDAQDPPEDDFVAEFAEGDDTDSLGPDFAHDEVSMDVESPTSGQEEPVINLFTEGDAPKADTWKRGGRRRERSFVRSLVLIVVAGLFGSAAGYYALLWITGQDFLNVAQYLPKTFLPASFDETKPIVRSAPPAPAADTMADVAPTTTDGGTDLNPSDESNEPQELPPATDETAEPMSDVAAATDAAPAAAADDSTEVPASYSEVEPAADANASSSAVGDRYSPVASDQETGAANDAAPTGVTSEKPATTDLSVDDLAPADEPATDSTADPSAVAPDLPSSTEPAATNVTGTDTTITEPATLEVPPAEPLADLPDTDVAAVAVDAYIAGAPTFSAEELRVSLATATKAQPQLATGKFSDGKDVQRAKGAGFSMLADLAQKVTFVDAAAKREAAQLESDADELFRKTLADPHTRADVAQILPMWIGSKNRKHGGAFFAGTVASHETSGSVVEYKVELDGGQTVTVLVPSSGAGEIDSSKPLAIVGLFVDKPAEQVSGYTGSAPRAFFARKFISLE